MTVGAVREGFDVASGDVNPQVAEVDAGLVALGAAIADQIDDALENGEGQERTKALYLGPHLVNILRELHATPEARRAANVIITDAKGGAPSGSSRAGARLEALKGGKSA